MILDVERRYFHRSLKTWIKTLAKIIYYIRIISINHQKMTAVLKAEL